MSNDQFTLYFGYWVCLSTPVHMCMKIQALFNKTLFCLIGPIMDSLFLLCGTYTLSSEVLYLLKLNTSKQLPLNFEIHAQLSSDSNNRHETDGAGQTQLSKSSVSFIGVFIYFCRYAKYSVLNGRLSGLMYKTFKWTYTWIDIGRRWNKCTGE